MTPPPPPQIGPPAAPAQPGYRPSRLWRLAVWALVAVYIACVVRTAWLSDDAYITFRTVENVVDGYGPRWNVVDRVQTYTHPLWMWFLAGLRALTGELYFTSLAASLVLSVAGVVLIAGKLARDARAAVVVLVVLVSSRAFVDYSTSGLENPMTHLLLLAFATVALRSEDTPARLRWLALLAGLTACTRTDLLLMLLPVLALDAWRARWWPAVRALAFGFAPLIAWSAFATVYYGFPHPNTALAKLFCLGVPAADLWAQGWLYLQTTAIQDPVTALGLIAGLLAALLGNVTTRLLALGIVVQVGYVARVGGDFMLGRFLTAPLVVAVACLASAAWLRRGSIALAMLVMIGVATALCPRIPFLSGGDYRGQGQVAHGIWDERGSYYEHLGLLSAHRVPFLPASSTTYDEVASEARPEIRLMTSVGGPGYVGGRRLHLVDPLVCDPLLARLPAFDPRRWRPGHTKRRVPEGYFESIAHADNRIVHPGLAEYYDALTLVTRAPLFDGARWGAILGLATGRYDAALQRFLDEAYRTPPARQVPAARLAHETQPWVRWTDTDAIVLCDGGVDVRFESVTTGKTLVAALHSGGRYRLRFSLRGQDVGVAEITTPSTPLPVISHHRAEVPEPARAGFDRIHVSYVFGESQVPIPVLASLILDPPGG